AADTAMCRACGTMHIAADLLHDDISDAKAQETASALLGPQPAGVSWRDDGQTLRVKARVGSSVLAGVFGVFALFWTIAGAFVIVDVATAATPGSVAHHIPDTPDPADAPDAVLLDEQMAEDGGGVLPGKQSGVWTPTVQRGGDIADWLIAGVLACIMLFFWLLTATCGLATATITIRPDRATLVKGLFPLRITHRFDPTRVTGVVEKVDTSTRVNGRNPTKIVIQGGDEIGFGGFMPDSRRRWVLALLQANLGHRR
ncbi:MAG: hypothetical protein KDA05_03520, partial [Phycisphaerales bacterium]|nr:hypothetical protein [Phycisphaerales bacterium]